MPRLLPAAAAATLVGLLLTGCVNPLEQLVQGGAESIVEGAIEGATGGDIDVNVGGSASIPDGFPSEVPLPPGSPTASFSIDNVFQLTYEVDDPSIAEGLVAELVSDGYTEIAASDLGELKTWIYESDANTVSLSVLDDGEGNFQIIVSVTVKE